MMKDYTYLKKDELIGTKEKYVGLVFHFRAFIIFSLDGSTQQ